MNNRPRIIIAATSSGSGKTTITCGILQALINRNLKVSSFKCGPDYIDPMFHSKVIGAKSKNIDSFFNDENTVRYLMDKSSKEADISVIEGVMGFYDGLAGISTESSSYDVARITNTPVVLVINCKGMSVSILPIIKGFKEYMKDSNVKGVILNQMSGMLYPDVKKLIEENLDVKVLGYVPNLKDIVLESRHLGLVTPDEIGDLRVKLNQLADTLEETLELDEIINLAGKAEALEYEVPEISKVNGNPKIAVAMDEAFCFYYEDNMELLKTMGADIINFSPLRDYKIPDNIDGLILGGGYPELYADKLSENKSMRESIKSAIDNGLPCVAECGGFMYLHDSMEDGEGKPYEMVGIVKGKAFKTSKLNRFGYIKLKAIKDNFLCNAGDEIAAHEFHYWDSTACGDSFNAQKPLRKRNWNCINTGDNLFAGYPHIHYYSNIKFAENFLNKCLKYKGGEEV